jgi:hypothetical protein
MVMDSEYRRILFISYRRYQGDRAQLETMLGTEFAGVLSSDDFSVYNGMVGKSQPNRSVWLIYDGISRKCWDFRATIIMQQSLKYFCH